MKLQPLLEVEEKPDLSDLEKKIIDLVLDNVKNTIIEYHDSIDDIRYSGTISDTFVSNAFDKFVKDADWTDEHTKLEKKFGKMPTRAWETAFKAKFGKSDKDFIKELEKEGEKKFSADELKFIKDASSGLITRLTIVDFNPENENHLRFYMKSPEKMVIDTPNASGIIYTNKSLEGFNLTLEKVKAMFERFGIKQGKRPVRKRSASSYSYYD